MSFMGSRRQAREYALQLLFQIEFSQSKLKEVMEFFWADHDADQEIKDFCFLLVEGTLRNLKELDHIIEQSSTNWKMSRMAAVDRNLLRQSAYEIIYLQDIPHSVTLNEAVEIAKKYGTKESSSFINGILDKIAHNI